MPKVLSLSMRPHALSALYGQDAVVKAIRSHVVKRPPSAWMFYGPSGVGKTTVARILSIAYQCEHMKAWGDPCTECWKRRSDFAIHEINASDVNGVEELGRVVRLSRYRPTNGGKRVIILDEAQKISNAAQNMLLSPFENPPESTVWIICTTEPAKILATLRRRCVTYHLKSLGIGESERFLAAKAKAAGIARPLDPLYEQCHLLEVSAPALLLMALEKYAAGASAEESAAGSEGSGGAETLRICKAVVAGNWNAARDEMKSVAPDSARLVRASVSGYLKGVLARENAPALQERAAVSLVELSAAPLEDAAMLQWLWGALWKVCRRYKR